MRNGSRQPLRARRPGPPAVAVRDQITGRRGPLGSQRGADAGCFAHARNDHRTSVCSGSASLLRSPWGPRERLWAVARGWRLTNRNLELLLAEDTHEPEHDPALGAVSCGACPPRGALGSSPRTRPVAVGSPRCTGTPVWSAGWTGPPWRDRDRGLGVGRLTVNRKTRAEAAN